MKYENGEPVLEEGVVYLRDTRNGKIYQYEASLAQMSFIQTFTAGVPTAEPGAEPDDGRPRPPAPELSALDRAEQYDAIARMSPTEREAAQAVSPIFTEQPAAPPEPQKNTTDKLLPVGVQAPLKDFYDNGWTDDQIVAKKHYTLNPDYIEPAQ